jgi:hypothetical protein
LDSCVTDILSSNGRMKKENIENGICKHKNEREIQVRSVASLIGKQILVDWSRMLPILFREMEELRKNNESRMWTAKQEKK